jgi:hypothetical protein
MRLKTKFLIVLAAIMLCSNVFSHGGGTNANGCHTNHETGDYHCHNKKPKSSGPNSSTYCLVSNGEKRCGYAKSTCNQLKNKYGGYCQLEF